MSEENHPLHLPSYESFNDSLASLGLPISPSELHGVISGYLCANAVSQGELYLRALLGNKKDDLSRKAVLTMFSVYAISQQQMSHFDFSFELMLPNEEAPLFDRARAFSEWCEGFVQGLTVAGVGLENFSEEEAQEALQHLIEFAELDTESLDVDEEDEKALMEVREYTRMAVLRLHADLMHHALHQRGDKIRH